MALVRARAKQILSPFPIWTGGGDRDCGGGEMITSRGCSAEPEMAFMKVQDLGELWLQLSINQSCLLSPPGHTKLCLVFSILGNLIACVDLPHAPISGEHDVPHTSQTTHSPYFQFVDTARRSQMSFPKKHQKNQKHWDPAVLRCVTFKM